MTAITCQYRAESEDGKMLYCLSTHFKIIRDPPTIHHDYCAHCPQRDVQCDAPRPLPEGAVLAPMIAIVTPSSTNLSDEEIARREAQMPGLARRARSFAIAQAIWRSAGKPERSDDEIEEIKSTHCRSCEKFIPTDDGSDGCAKCGCKKLLGLGGLTAKLKMATEGCPLGHFPPKVTL